MYKIILTLILTLFCIHVAFSYCPLDLFFNLSYLENVSNNIITFNVTNFSKINLSTYRHISFESDTNKTKIIDITFDCNKTKTFFIIFDGLNTSYISNVKYNVTANTTINIMFLISPVLFGNYSIKEYGILGENITTIYLDSPYLLNRTYVFPFVPEGEYYHVFEVTNGREVRYLNYIFKNIVYPNPEILELFLQNATYGKTAQISFFARNIKNATITFLPANKTIQFVNVSKDYFKVDFLINDTEVEKIRIDYYNEYKNASMLINYTLQPLDLSNTSIYKSEIIYPSVKVNQTTKILLIDFKTETPLLIKKIESKENYFGEEKFFDFYITNEKGERYDANSLFFAKQIYLFILPSKPARGQIIFNLSSFTITNKEILFDFLSSNETKPEKLNITYFNRIAECAVQGENVLESVYICKFEVPASANINALQSEELTLIQTSYQEKIKLLEESLKQEKDKFNKAIIFFVIVAIIVSFYLTREFWLRLLYAVR